MVGAVPTGLMLRHSCQPPFRIFFFKPFQFCDVCFNGYSVLPCECSDVCRAQFYRFHLAFLSAHLFRLSAPWRSGAGGGC